MENLIKVLNPTSSRKYLICIPYAGGNSIAFKPIQLKLGGDWQVISLDPPGHGSNADPLINNLEMLVQLYIERLRSYFQYPYVLFGHSMGGIIAHRMAQVLELEGMPPAAVIVSGSVAPDRYNKHTIYRDDESLLAHVTSFGGIPDELLQYSPFMDYYLPVIRADYEALRTYVCPSDYRLISPLYVFYGTEDHIFTNEDTTAWLKWARQMECVAFTGGHLFLVDQIDELTARISAILNDVITI